MRVFLRPQMLSAAFVLGAMGAGAVPAAAAVIDFTAASNVSGSVNGIGWSLSSGSPRQVITFEDSDAPGPIGVLAGLNDGVGLNDDEISEGREFLTVTFTQEVRLTGFWALDLFEDGLDDTDPETALVYAGSTPEGAPAASLAASEVFAPGGFGFSFGSTDLFGDTFTFAASSGNDGIGRGDFALAGLQIEETGIPAVPLPAAGFMIGTALLGFRMMRRR